MKKLSFCLVLLALCTVTFAGCGKEEARRAQGPGRRARPDKAADATPAPETPAAPAGETK